MHIESTLPLWLVLPLIALAVFVMWMLYFRKQQESVLPKPVRILLAISRMLVLIFVGLLIISPWIRTTVIRVNKPYFIVAQDNSVSILPVQDTAGFRLKRSKLKVDLVKSLENDFQVKNIYFGSRTTDMERGNFTDPVTDPGEFFDYLRLFAQTHDLAGVQITSDGVATRGITFSEAAKNFPYPVSVLASGDSSRFPDVRIQEVVSNEWVRKNSTFPVRVYYNTGDYTGSGFKLQLSGANGIIQEKAFKTGTQVSTFEEFLIQSPDKGTMQLKASIIPDQHDKNQDNNSKRFLVKVLEQEGEILCLYESAHPDIDAVVQSLKGTNSLNVNVLKATDYAGSDKDYDLIILHGLPSQKNPLGELVKKAADRQIPILFIIGKSTDPVMFSRANPGLAIDNRRKTGESSRGTLNASFTLFTLPADFKSHLDTWPPLELSFETFVLNPGSQILMKQKILNVELSDPLVSFSNAQGVKYGFFCGEGIWLWRLHEFLEQKNHDYFDEWLSRTIQYLMLDEKTDKFKVTIPEELFAYSPLRINGHLLNSSLEATNDPEVLFTVTDSAGQQTEYQMGRINDYYELNISGFPPGTYGYTAETKLGDEIFRRTGEMVMIVRPVEQTEPVAEFESLRSIALRTKGKFFSPGQESNLLSYLNDLKPSEMRIKKEFKWYDLINFKWLLGALIFLLAMEWFLRRWFGIR